MDSSERNKKTKKEVILSLLYKGVDGIAYFLLVSLSLSFLGQNSYSTWLALSSVIIWIYHLDFGLGDSLRNNLTKVIAHNEFEKIGVILSSTIFGVMSLSAIYILALAAGFYFYSLTHGPLSTGESLLISTCLMALLVLNLKLVEKIYHAILMPSVVGMIATAIRVISCLMIYFYLLSKVKENLMLVTYTFMAIPAVVYIISIIYLKHMKKIPSGCIKIKYISIEYLSKEIKTCFYFFVLQLFSPLLAFVSNLFLYKLLSSNDIITFNISNRYLSIVLVAFSTIIGSLWNITTDAREMKDSAWILDWISKMRRMCLSSLAVLMAMVFFSPIIYRLWLGNAVNIEILPTFLMGIFVFFNIWNHGHTVFLQAYGELKTITIVSISVIMFFVPLIPLASNYFGVLGMLVVLLFAYAVVGMYSYNMVQKVVVKSCKL